jgi:hypothetical protein
VQVDQIRNLILPEIFLLPLYNFGQLNIRRYGKIPKNRSADRVVGIGGSKS